MPRLRFAVTAIFALNGAMFASLFARMPALKGEAGLSNGELALGLFVGSIGLLLSQPLAGALSARFGSRPVVAAGALAYGGLLPLPALADGPGSFAACMFTLSLGAGLLDVAMNAQGVLAEDRHSRRIFSSFHAAFSFGALVGAATAGVVAEAGVDPLPHLALVGAVGAAGGIATTLWMLGGEADTHRGGPSFARPSRALAALGVIGLAAAMAEGSVGDWSAILLSEERDASSGLAAAGLAAFSLTMAVGRLAVDPLAERLGPVAVTRGGALVAAAGLALALAPLDPAAAILGFAVMGAGLAGLFPLTLAAAGRVERGAPGIAAVSTAAYLGFLVGPATIGTLAELASLPAGLVVLLPLCALVAWLAPAVSAPAGAPRARP